MTDPSADVSADLVEAVSGASHLMRHRGPDEPARGTTMTSCSVSTGCRSSTSRTATNRCAGPAESPNRYVLVFNGEIYNYLELREELAAGHGATFHTDGDGEAIIAAYHYWGTDALTRLRGMFAFALWDTVERIVLRARDPFGIKPLFMATGPAGTAVGSEKKCLLDLADELGIDIGIDDRAVQHYTVLQYVPSPRRCTAARTAGVGQLRPGAAGRQAR